MNQKPEGDLSFKDKFINYSEHPGFKGLISVGGKNSKEGATLFKRIDDFFFEQIQGSKTYEAEKIERSFEENIKPDILRLEDLVISTMVEGDRMLPVALKSIEKVYVSLKEEAHFRNQAKNFDKKSKDQNQMTSDLEVNGFFIKRLDEGKIRLLWNEIESFRHQLSEKRKGRPQGMASCTVPLPQEGKRWKILNSLLDEAGIKEALSSYSRFPLDLDYYVLQLSHDDEQWWKNCYDDVGLSTSQMSYLHQDLDYSLIKAILYLQPVTENNGPFSIIPASRNLASSYSRMSYFKWFDQEIQPIYATDPEAQSSYYRKHFKLKKFRREFLKLPEVLRGTSHFGDDLLDDSEVVADLRQRELKVTTDIGNFAAFLGGHILHRGGMVEKGERWAIQIGFRPRDISWNGVRSRIKKSIKSNLPEGILKSIRNVKSKTNTND